jgi:hypothetical protein
LSEIIKSQNKDEKYRRPNGKHFLRRERENKKKVLAEVRNSEGKFVKYVKTREGTNPLDAFF